jgi:methylmalonyl-CoA mutase C-terminal domain/subunit
MVSDRPGRVLLAKVGLDGHDLGLRVVVARILRDAGFEVIFAGLRQTPEMITAAVTEEDVDVVGVSMHNGAHLTLAPAVVRSLRDAGLGTPVLVGGIVPEVDMPEMKAAGVAAVLGPRASNNDVVATVRAAAEDCIQNGSRAHSGCGEPTRSDL